MPRLRWLKRVVQAAFEGLWSIGFKMVGRLARLRPEVWSSPGGERILVIATHPDDEVAGCAGAMLEHHHCGDVVKVCCVTDGGLSRALNLKPSDMAAVRRREIEAAIRALGAELEWLGMSEGQWQIAELTPVLADSLRAFGPHVIYAPSRVDFHPEHRRVARALAEGLASVREGHEIVLRIYPSQVPLTSVLTNLIVPMSPNDSRLLTALHAYSSQFGSIERCWRHRRYSGACYGYRGAEEFWCMSSTRYERLHRELPQQSSRRFRGLRYYAWSDPLAYLLGRGERRRLKLAAEDR